MKKNIGLLIPTLNEGGAERAISRLSYILENEGYNVFMIVFDAKLKYHEHAGELINLNSSVSKSIFGKFLNTIIRVLKLRKVKKEKKLDTVISYLDGANIVNILSKSKERCIVSIRNYKSLEKKGIIEKLYQLSLPIIYNSADYVVAVSKLIAKDLIDNFGIHKGKVEVIYNPYDINQIEIESSHKIPAEYTRFYEDHNVVVSVGRLVHQKGYWNLIKALKVVKRRVPNAGVVILGKGPLENDLRQLAIDCGVIKDVLFAGYQSNPFPFIKNASVYALPSLYEGFPNAMVEAMCCGVPVVSNDCKSGPREILSNRNELNQEIRTSQLYEYGIITPSFNQTADFECESINYEQQEFAESIIRVLNDPKIHLNYKEKSIERAKDFSYDSCLNKWKELIS